MTLTIETLVSGDAASTSSEVGAARAATTVAQAVASAESATCKYGHTWCTGGTDEHPVCTGPLLTCLVPGFEHPIPTLDVQIMDLGEGDGTKLTFSGDSHDGCNLTADQLRGVVADLRNHLDQLLAVADQYDALTGGA